MPERIDIRYEESENRLYALLQAQTEERLRGLSGNIWTSFRTHDPGVTMNDVLNYILTDFDYKLHFNLEDYLCTEQAGMIPEETGLLDSSSVTLSGPVTAADYQELILKHFPAIDHVQFLPLRQKDLSGVYDVHIQVCAGMPEEEKKQLESAVRRVYYDHRNLCEDLRTIHIAEVQGEHRHTCPVVLDDLLDNEDQQSHGSYRNIYTHIPARHEFPDFYGINDWGLTPDASEKRKMQATQLKAYLSLFDELLIQGLEELKGLPGWLRLTADVPEGKSIVLKQHFLNNLERLYGEQSDLPFMRAPNGKPETAEGAIRRRIDFLKNIPYWGRDRHKATYMNSGEVFGMERYFRQLLCLSPDETIRVIEHTFFRNLIEPIRSKDDIPVEFPLELYMSIFIYGSTKRMSMQSFRKGLELVLYKRIPAHLDTSIHWLEAQESARLDVLYRDYLNDGSETNTDRLKNFIIEIRTKKDDHDR